ncbi:MAG: SDR family oxidoreductase [Chloroflexi bacterium]|nr:SDR family oxidoreductase [Chloroflexota bacterium]
MSLQGTVVVITGASRGIGRALAVGFAAEGATVVAAARTLRPDTGEREGSLEETVRQITDAGGKAIAAQCDVADEAQVKALVERTLAEAGPIDVLINNAGILLSGLLTEIDTSDWDMAMAVNVRGPFLTCKYFLPGMIERRKGNIINITSRAAGRDDVNRLPYAATKAALERLTLNLSMDMKSYDIAVNILGPGLIQSRPLAPGQQPTNRDGRVAEAPETVVPAALWLAQQTAEAFTGRVVHRDEFGDKWP